MFKRLLDSLFQKNLPPSERKAGVIYLLEGWLEEGQRLEDEMETVSWEEFIYKAARGSYKATWWLRDAETASILKLSGDPEIGERDLDEYYAQFGMVFSELDFQGKPERIVECMVRHAWIEGSIALQGHMLHPREHYQSLWDSGMHVSEADLQHDAILELSKHWSLSEYRKRVDRIHDEDPDYNSLDVTVCMIAAGLAFPYDADRSRPLDACTTGVSDAVVTSAQRKPAIKFMLDYGGSPVLWAMDDTARQKFGYAIDAEEIGLSQDCQDLASEVAYLYYWCLDPLYQGYPSFWSQRMCEHFNARMRIVYDMICAEIGDAYNVSCFHEEPFEEDPDLAAFLDDPVSYSRENGVSFGPGPPRRGLTEWLAAALTGVDKRAQHEAEAALRVEAEEACTKYLQEERQILNGADPRTL